MESDAADLNLWQVLPVAYVYVCILIPASSNTHSQHVIRTYSRQYGRIHDPILIHAGQLKLHLCLNLVLYPWN